MNPRFAAPGVLTLLLAFFCAEFAAAENAPYSGAACSVAVEPSFVENVWGRVASQECIKCHKAGGDAEDSEFVLRDPAKLPEAERDAAMRHNRAAFAAMAWATSGEQDSASKNHPGDESRLLLKAQGKLKHKGKEVLAPDSAGYKILADFVKRVTAPASAPKEIAVDKNAPPFFSGIAMLDDKRLLRRATLSLAGRLPTDEELAQIAAAATPSSQSVAAQSVAATPSSQHVSAAPPPRGAIFSILDNVMKEDAFFERLREAFNDIFLTLGLDGNADATVLAYEHFEKTRLWFQREKFEDIADPKERQQAKYRIAREYREALLGEPMKLIEHIVREGRPFTEIITADYIMMTPHTARGYGMFEEVKARFKNADDPFEYIPVRLNALKGRSRQTDQESSSGFFPHAGILSTFQWLTRYPTTETNRNRLRARMYYQHFLGVDVLELAARVTDAAAVTAKYKVPTMEATECVVCHKTLDPIASLFQDYWKFAAEGVYGRRKDGWFTDMFQAGFEGEDMPAPERWRSLQWLGERTARDPRFAVAMTEHAFYMLTGRRVLLPPKDLDDPLYAAKRRAYSEQRSQTEKIAARFAKNGFEFKGVLKDWIASDFYRADGLAVVVSDPQRRAELDDTGIARMLAPEQLERKLAAIFGKGWGRLHSHDGGLGMLYGGIDSKEVTERATDPGGAMGAIMRTLSNDIACRHTALDFSRAPEKRVLFRDIEPDVVPGDSADGDAKIRRTIAHLHARVLGHDDSPDSPAVARTYQLFADIVGEAAEHKRIAPEENYNCRQNLERPVADPKYTVRAWRAVLTFLLRQQDFLYE